MVRVLQNADYPRGCNHSLLVGVAAPPGSAFVPLVVWREHPLLALLRCFEAFRGFMPVARATPPVYGCRDIRVSIGNFCPFATALLLLPRETENRPEGRLVSVKVEATTGFEPVNRGFAEPPIASIDVREAPISA